MRAKLRIFAHIRNMRTRKTRKKRHFYAKKSRKRHNNLHILKKSCIFAD